MCCSYSEAWEQKSTEKEAAEEQDAEDKTAGRRARKRVPKIYYATRTHSQIAQVLLATCSDQAAAAIVNVQP